MANAFFDLSSLDGKNGFVINGGIDESQGSLAAVSAAGDINNDGFADLIIASSYADPNGKSNAGQSYVLFGSADGFSTPVDLASLQNGFFINGIDPFDSSGSSVSGAGDINADGIADLIIGAYGADPNGNSNAGESYVVFGSTNGFPSILELSTLNGSNGFILNGIDNNDRSGISVSGDVDINGDGIDDIIIGAPYADREGNSSAGESYVVFGSANGFSSQVDLAGLDGSNGFTIQGIDGKDFLGESVSGAGDINGDGIDDLIVEATGADRDGNSNTGETYVVFGSANGFPVSVDLAALDGSNGFVINGVDEHLVTDRSISAAGDFNGDGLADLIIGAPEADPDGNSNAGETYLVFGSSDGFSGSLDLEDINGSNGFVIKGVDVDDRSGSSVSGAGDLNGDGLTDLIVLAEKADPNGNTDAGEAYVIYGNALPQLDLNGEAEGLDFATSLENGSVSVVSGDLTLTDANRSTIVSATVAIANIRDGDNESLAADTSGTGITANFDPATGTLTLTGEDSVSNYQQVLRSVTYHNTATSPEPVQRIIDFAVNDGGAGNGVATTTVTVNSNAPISSFDLNDIDGSNGFAIAGIDTDDKLGFSVSAAGDVNDDGIEDIIISAPEADPHGNRNAGSSYVVFGRDDGFSASVDLLALDGNNGFAIAGIDAQDRSGTSVSKAGDINGDGIDDLVIGVPFGKYGTSEAYVVFGRADGFDANLELETLDGSNGFAIEGIDTSGFNTEIFVSDAGDINGDGIDDLIVGSPFADPNGYASGESYVVFGGGNLGTDGSIDLRQLDGNNGFAINGIESGDRFGYSLSSAGDVNGDGFDDLILGTSGFGDGGPNGAGGSYVVFGQADGFSADLELTELNGSNGFAINGIDAGDRSGYAVSGAGDINGDGYSDLLVGAAGADPNGEDGAGETYVVFGQPDAFSASFELANLDGSNGFVINGIDPLDNAGISVSGAGDFNNDGYSDLIIGASGADANGYEQAGESYVLFGKADGFLPSLDLEFLDGKNGLTINGIDANDFSGSVVSGVGDINNDGFHDVIIGASFADPGGEAYVVFGNDYSLV